MQLVEQHNIKRTHPYFKELDKLCFLSKNLYNRANYIIRQEFIESSKIKEAGEVEHATYLNYNSIQKSLQEDRDFDYYNLPTKVSQQVLKLLDKNWVSFFKSIKDWKKNPDKYQSRPKLPKYKNPSKGRYVLIYTNQAFSTKKYKDWIVLSGTNIKIKTRWDKNSIIQVRVVPRNNEYLIELVYEREVNINENLNKKNIAGLDIGLKNLASITSNKNDVRPILINGRPLKSINQFFNKRRAKLQSHIGDVGTSNKIVSLTNKRNKKVKNYLHNASRKIVNHLLKNDIGILIIGKNINWKQNINIGKRNNQNFVSIPFDTFIKQIVYKCELEGIEVILIDESYTSKCSFIDMEPVHKHDAYAGKRIRRGLFVSRNNIAINADCNASGNIIRKAVPDAFADGIEGVVVHPLRITPYKINCGKIS
jgi:putative transposase